MTGSSRSWNHKAIKKWSRHTDSLGYFATEMIEHVESSGGHDVSVDVVTAWQADHADSVQLSNECLYSGTDVSRLVQDPRRYVARLFCMTQSHSWDSLDSQTKILRAVMSQYSITPHIMDVLSCFYSKTEDIEQARCPAFFQQRSAEHDEYMYLIKYPEANKRRPDDPWSIRQTALYHQVRLQDHRSTYVLISPTPRSQGQVQLLDWISSITSVAQTARQAFAVHNLLISAYIEGWRSYLKYQDQMLEQLDMRMLALAGRETNCVTPDDMIDLHFVEKKLLPAVHLLRSFRETVISISKCYAEHSTRVAKLDNAASPSEVGTNEPFSRRMNMLLSEERYATALLQKCSSIASLLSGLLDLRSQSSMLDLTTSAVDDSATVRVISAIFLIYLAATSVANVLSMPFFTLRFDDQHHEHLDTSSQFWIYVAIAAPLTIVTLLYWQISVYWRKRRRLRKQQNDLESKW